MLNMESRKYFKRAMVMSGSVYSYFALNEGNQLHKIQECAQTTDKSKVIQYLKTEDSKVIQNCYLKDEMGKTLKLDWAPTIEPQGTPGAMIDKSPEVIWTSNEAPRFDTLFSFNSEVIFFSLNRIDLLNVFR